MKPLTIEQLKALKVGDWIFVADKGVREPIYVCIISRFNERIYVVSYLGNHNYKYSDYGKTWLAWKNKEQAEIVDGAVTGKCRYVKNGKCTNPSAEAIDCPTEVYDKYSCYSDCDWFEAEYPRTEAKVEIVELPCLRDKPTLYYHGEPILRKELNYMTKDGTIVSVPYSEDEFDEAERRLAELKGEK